MPNPAGFGIGHMAKLRDMPGIGNQYLLRTPYKHVFP